MTYYVLFNNDMPELVFDNLAAAEAEAKARQTKAEREARLHEYVTAYWHVHAVKEAP